jgi:general secretion pathway protein G
MAGCRQSNSVYFCKEAGYTMIELMVVVVVGALLAAVAVPGYTLIVERANMTSAIADIGQIQLAVARFRLNIGRLPTTLAEAGQDTLTDPWGNPYQYLNIEAGAGLGDVRKDRNLVPINSDYDLYSMGKDGRSAPALTSKMSRDDIVRANNGGYVGLVENY